MANNQPIVINGHEIAGRMPQFKPELRQANRDGRKRMTRRVMKVQPPDAGYKSCTLVNTTDRELRKYEGSSHWVKLDESGLNIIEDQGLYFKSRYKVGDIRVMCEPLIRVDGGMDNEDYAHYSDDDFFVIIETGDGDDALWWRWKKDYLTSIHMPYEAGRALFRITEIRAERLQEISIDDIVAEGVKIFFNEKRQPLLDISSKYAPIHYLSGSIMQPSYNELLRAYMASLWDSINAEPKRRNHNPYTQKPEKCYVSYPWEDIRETREHRGLKWYVIGNPHNWVIGYEAVNG